jgi:hypothetical protein
VIPDGMSDPGVLSVAVADNHVLITNDVRTMPVILPVSSPFMILRESSDSTHRFHRHGD